MNSRPDDPSLIRFPTQRELLTAIFRRWFLVVLGASLGLAWGINVVHSLPYLYTVEMRVTPAQRGTSANVGTGLAALVNLALPSAESGSDFSLYLDLIKSRNVADELAKDPKIMHTIWAGNWDEASQKWVDRPETRRLQLAEKRVYDFLGYPSVPWREPDGEALLGFINYYVTIEQDPRRPYMARIVMNYADKEFAMQLLRRLHQTADEMLRQRAIKRTTDYIAYLSGTLAKITVAEHRLAIAQALSEQEKAAMAARSGAAFAAEVLEQPWANSYPSSPSVLQTLARWTFIGTLAGCALALLFWSIRRSWQARTVRRSRKLAIASSDLSA